MHPSTEQLLSLRDGQPVDAGTVAHLDACAQCAAELQRLQSVRAAMRELPPIAPPAAAWAAIEAQLHMPARRYRSWWPAIAAAAVAAVALGVWVGLPGDDHSPQKSAGPVVAAAEPVQDGVSGAPALAQLDDAPGVNTLMAESRELEQLLRAVNERSPRIMRADMAGAIAELEDGIAVIDYGLTYSNRLSGDDSEQLWQRRVDLMNTLVQVRGAQLQRVSN